MPQQVSHDDPIVVDNAPVRFNFTRELKTIDEEQNFTRTYTAFDSLIVTRVENSGAVTTDTRHLKADSEIVFHLRSAKNAGKEEEVTLTATNGDLLKVSIKNGKLKKKPNAKEMMEPDYDDDMRIVSIAFRNAADKPDEVSLVDGGGNFRYIGLIALIKANPH